MIYAVVVGRVMIPEAKRLVERFGMNWAMFQQRKLMSSTTRAARLLAVGLMKMMMAVILLKLARATAEKVFDEVVVMTLSSSPRRKTVLSYRWYKIQVYHLDLWESVGAISGSKMLYSAEVVIEAAAAAVATDYRWSPRNGYALFDQTCDDEPDSTRT